jgi:hypothetical protein
MDGHTTVVTLTRTTLAIGDTTAALAYPWTSAQECGSISVTILEPGTTTTMMIKWGEPVVSPRQPPAEWSKWNVSLRLAVAPAWPAELVITAIGRDFMSTRLRN